MTTKKAITKKARGIRATIKGLTLPQSVKIAKSYIKGDKSRVADLLVSFGYQLDYDLKDGDDCIYGRVAVKKDGKYIVSLPYLDGIVIYS